MNAVRQTLFGLEVRRQTSWAPRCTRAAGCGLRRRSMRRCRVQVAQSVTRGRSVADAADEVGLGWRPGM